MGSSPIVPETNQSHGFVDDLSVHFHILRHKKKKNFTNSLSRGFMYYIIKIKKLAYAILFKTGLQYDICFLLFQSYIMPLIAVYVLFKIKKLNSLNQN